MRRTSRLFPTALFALAVVTLAGCPSADEEQTWTLQHYKEPCWGVGAGLCLQVSKAPSEPLGLSYDGIDGFTYEWGHRYELRVVVTEVANPPADGSSQRYELLEVISDTIVNERFEMTLSSDFIIGDPATGGFSLIGERDVSCAEVATCDVIAAALEIGNSVVVELGHNKDSSALNAFGAY